MIALFDEPPRVSIKAGWTGSGNGLLLGMTQSGSGVLYGIICLEDGEIAHVEAAGWSVDYRYEVQTDRWIDINALKPAQPDQEG